MQPSAGYCVRIPDGGLAEVYLDKDTSRSRRSILGRDHKRPRQNLRPEIPAITRLPGYCT